MASRRGNTAPPGADKMLCATLRGLCRRARSRGEWAASSNRPATGRLFLRRHPYHDGERGKPFGAPSVHQRDGDVYFNILARRNFLGRFDRRQPWDAIDAQANRFALLMRADGGL